MKPRHLGGLLLLTLLSACQVPWVPMSGKTVTVHLPTSGSRGGGYFDTPLTAYPPGVLATLDHFVVKITDGAASLVPDQTAAVDATSVTFTGVPAGDHQLVIEAWTAAALTAVGQIPVTVTDDLTTSVGPAVLAPVSGSGNGQFDLLVSVGNALQTLLNADSVGARLKPLSYSSGNLVAVGAVLDPGTVSLTNPGDHLMRLQASNLPSGNYLLEIVAWGYDLPTATLNTIATVAVQVYADQTSTLPAGTTLVGSLSGSLVDLPLALRVDLADDGTRTLSWEAPIYTVPTTYQVGYSLSNTDTQPTSELAVTGGLNPNDLKPGTDLHPVGDRYQVGLDLGGLPWSPAQPFARLFVRALQGPAAASDWASLDVAPASTASGLPLGHLSFSGLVPGMNYALQRLTAGNQVLESRTFITGTATEEVTVDFPGLVLKPGEKLNLVQDPSHSPQNYPIDPTLLTPATPGLYGPSTVFRAYFGYLGTDLSHSSKVYYLTTDSLAAPAGVTGSLAGLDWDRTNGGQAWPQLFTQNAGVWEIESDRSPPVDTPWNPGFPGTGLVSFPGKWIPPAGTVTRYRVRAGYQFDFNADTVVDVTLYGPASGWVAVDRMPPQAFFSLTNGSTFDVNQTTDIELNVVTDENLGDFGISLLNRYGSVALPPEQMPTVVNAWNNTRLLVWRTDWVNATAPQRNAWANLPPGQYYLQLSVYDLDGNMNLINIPFTLVGGPLS